VHWFRKGLRLSDNPALFRAIRRCETFRCIFILDPWFAGSSNVGTNKWRFLLQCLEDLDTSLRKLNSRLFVVRGQPADVLPTLFKEWGTNYFTFEEDPEPFGRVRDQNIIAMCKDLNITVTKEHSHTLFNLDRIIEKNEGKAPLTYKRFQSIIEAMDPPAKPVPTLTLQMLGSGFTPVTENHDEKYAVPTLEELGFETDNLKATVWHGGETEALSRLERHLERKAWVASFGRPKMTPQSLLASQTGLSPYLRFGCLSTRLFFHALSDLYRKIKKCEPPLSLHGQLLWREFFYCAATKNPNFDKMSGNPICVQIPWDKNDEALAKWANAHTGFPWIDAIMTQLRDEGWIHHLARHAVACFLTRGDLWISWEEGMKVFEELSLDADWSVNAGTWLWLSCSSFFQQFFHCYCPVKFGRKADANGDFIRRYLPVLKNFPTRYIHEPWTAPEAVQKSARCIIGQDYPKPICNHSFVSKINMDRMKQVYQQLAHFSQTGQSGVGIPVDLLSQLPKKIPGPEDGGMMGPPNLPDAKKKVSADCSQGEERSNNSVVYGHTTHHTNIQQNKSVKTALRPLDVINSVSVPVSSVLVFDRKSQQQGITNLNVSQTLSNTFPDYGQNMNDPNHQPQQRGYNSQSAQELLSGDILVPGIQPPVVLLSRSQDNGNIITSALSVMNGGVVDSLTNVFSDNSISCLDNFNSLQTGGGGNLTDLSAGHLSTGSMGLILDNLATRQQQMPNELVPAAGLVATSAAAESLNSSSPTLYSPRPVQLPHTPMQRIPGYEAAIPEEFLTTENE